MSAFRLFSLRRAPVLVGGLLVAALALPRASEAQDLRFKTVSNTEWAGFMGSMMAVSGEDTGPDTTTTWIKGPLRREDQANGKASWVIDLNTMDMMRIDHEEHVFWSMNFPAFMQSSDSSTAAAGEQMTEEERAQMGTIEPSLQVDRTGEIRTINGWEAERVIMTMTLAPPADARAMENAEGDPMAAMMGQSSMVMLTELWISDDLPGYQEMKEALGKGAGDFGAGSGGMESLTAGYPQMAAMVEELEEEMQGLEGEAVRSTVYTLMVPTGAELPRDSILALSDAPLPQGPDLSSLMADILAEESEDAAADAVTQAIGGRLGGLLGRARDEQKDQEEERARMEMAGAAPRATVMSRVVTEIIDVERPALTEADFRPPEGYTETEGPFAAMSGPGQD